ncbi:UNVERIFIED_CONTAM: hypothetical protein Slati_2710000 [Sesamum latifolium]|uniref:Transposase n=1 Tax=Sesamum latifolium TaxID=2727402 RepID=A0AAW2W0C0_9LAMI
MDGVLLVLWGVQSIWKTHMNSICRIIACYYDCHRQFLPPDHPYRRNKKAFTKNRVERKVARPRLMREQIRDWVEEFSPVIEVSLSLPDGYRIEHRWTKKSICWELEYWSIHLI